jgi:uncharacterized phage protein gp47/JayE
MSSTAFVKSYDTILNDILTDFRNIFPDVDTATGSLAYMKAAGYASALWGLYRYQEWIAKQIFPDTADSAQLDHHAWVRGLTRNDSESDADLLARLLAYIRRPPAGGNKYDYEIWALEAATGVQSAYVIPMGQGLGTTDIVILTDADYTGSEIPTAEMLETVRDYIVDICPTAVKYLRVLAPTVITQAVTMTVTGDADLVDNEQIESDIEDYINALEPGDDLYISQLVNIAIQNGADDAVVSVPAANVTATNYQIIRAGTVTIA